MFYFLFDEMVFISGKFKVGVGGVNSIVNNFEF